MKKLHINHKWFIPDADDATLLAVLKYILRDEIPDDETLLDRIAPTLDRIDTDRRAREAARLRRATRAREAKAARQAAALEQTALEPTAHNEISTPEATTTQVATPEAAPLTPDHCARIFHSFPAQIRTDLALREVNRLEAETYPTFKQFIADFSPISRYNPEANWTRFRQLFPTTWHTLTPLLPSHLIATDFNTRLSTPTEFFTLLNSILRPC